MPDRVMSSVCLDLFELSPVVDDEGTTWDGVLLCTDRLSGYMIGKPICFKGLTGEKAAKILLDAWESFFDVPTELTTDRDPKFLSAWFSTICAGLGINVAYSQAYKHQENGRAEVANKNVLNTLRKMRASVGDTVQGESWFAALRATIRNHNQRVDPELGLSPQEILTGRARLGPAPCLPPVRECVGASEWLAHMRDMDLLAKQHVHSQQVAMRARYDVSRDKPHHFEVGDRVWVRYERKVGDNKLVPYWLGPAVVRERLGRKTFLVSAGDTKSEEHSVSDLKPYYPALQGDSVPLYWSRQYIVRVMRFLDSRGMLPPPPPTDAYLQ